MLFREKIYEREEWITMKKLYFLLLATILTIGVSTVVSAANYSDGDIKQVCIFEKLQQAEQDLQNLKVNRGIVEDWEIEQMELFIDFLETNIQLGSPLYVVSWDNGPETSLSEDDKLSDEYISTSNYDVSPRNPTFANGGTRTTAFMAITGVVWSVEHVSTIIPVIRINRTEGRTVDTWGGLIVSHVGQHVDLRFGQFVQTLSISNLAINRWSRSYFSLRQDGWDIVQRRVNSPFSFPVRSEPISVYE